jgi:hypothetical protein
MSANVRERGDDGEEKVRRRISCKKKKRAAIG